MEKKEMLREISQTESLEEINQVYGAVEGTPEYAEKVRMKRVLALALEAGRILLKNGAEIFRVEDTIDHICRRFNIESVDYFVLSNGIFITAECDDSEIFAKVKYIPMSDSHLGIVSEVNDLSREISAGKIGLEEAYEKLKEIDKRPPNSAGTQIAAAGIGCGAFCYLLGGNLPESLITSMIVVSLYTCIVFYGKNLSKMIVNIVGGAFITVLALVAINIPFEFLVRLDRITIAAILPMFAGIPFVNSIRDIANGDFLSGIARMIDALLSFVYIAIGVGIMLSFYEGVLGRVIQ